MTREPWSHRWVGANGLRFHCVSAGEGPLVLLLHGFPEFWYSWRYQIPALAAAGFTAVAPDLRGYNESDKPEGVEAYRISQIVEAARDPGSCQRPAPSVLKAMLPDRAQTPLRASRRRDLTS